MNARAFLILITLIACKRKIEILPADAKQIYRVDTREGEISKIELRQYKFSTVDAARHSNLFICESREYETADLARQGAKIKIAERPQEEIRSERAVFARSGRSLWLLADRQLIWCMLTSGETQKIDAAIANLRNLFMQKYREAQ